MQSSREMPSHHPCSFMNDSENKEVGFSSFHIGSPSSCLSAPEEAKPLSALQFSETEQMKRCVKIKEDGFFCLYIQQLALQMCNFLSLKHHSLIEINLLTMTMAII